MSLPIEISNYIDYGNVSSFLASNDFSGQNVLSGGSFNSDLPMRLNLVTRLVEWKFGKDPTDTTLINTGNYLNQLIGKYRNLAKLIIANNMPGIIINPATGAQSTLQPIYLQFRMGVTTSPQVVNGVNVTLPNNGDSSFVLPLTYVLASLQVVKDGDNDLPINDPLQLSYNPIYTNNNVTITLTNGDTFQNGDLWVINGYQFVSI
jgi:hypothetical protein